MQKWRFARRRAVSDERGLSILEVVLAMTLFALAVVGIGTSATGGLRLTGTSNSRQGATQVATRFMEKQRAANFAVVGLEPTTTYDAVAGSPDLQVDTTASPRKFTVPLPNPVTEELVETGGTLHRPPDVSFGARRFQVYQYVTWADSSHKQKRVTVVVLWSGVDNKGVRNRVVMSSLFTSGKIAFMASSSTSTPPSTTSTSTAPSTTTTTVASTCPGDTLAPTPDATSGFYIANGSGVDAGSYVTSQTVQLKWWATDPCVPITAAFSNNGGATWGSEEPIAASKPSTAAWTLTAGEGTKTVQARFRDGTGNAGNVRNDTVFLDLQDPTTPPSPTGTADKHAATVRWTNSSTDATPGGAVFNYSVSRATGTGAFDTNYVVVVGSAECGAASGANCFLEDKTVVPGQSYTYRIAAVDRSGRASTPTATISCSVPSSNATSPCT